MKVSKQGIIIKKLDDRSAVVETFLMKTHPIYKKSFKVIKKYIADDKENKFKTGDIVKIQECRPISKTKRFEIIEKTGSVGSVEEDKIAGEEVLGAEEPKEEDLLS